MLPSTLLHMHNPYPYTQCLPSTAHARDRLLAKIFKYRKEAAARGAEDDGPVVATDEDYEILYAYILVTGQLAEEIKKVEKEVEDMFGVMDEELLRRSMDSPSLACMSFWITTFMAWKASSILFVASMMRPYSFEGNGPRSSNSLTAAVRIVLS